MSGTAYLIPGLLLWAPISFMLGRGRARQLMQQDAARPHSMPVYHGVYVALLSVLPAFLFYLLWLTARTSPLLADLQTAPGFWGSVAVLLAGGLCWGLYQLHTEFPARVYVERVARVLLWLSAFASVLITAAIVLSVLFEALRFFSMVSVVDFLFGLHWSPQMAGAHAAGEIGKSFGAIPVFTGTLMITVIAMLVAVPIGLLSAIYMSEYASRRFRAVVKPILEVLAGVPTVVYGYFAIIAVAPLFRGLGQAVGLDIASESALVAGMVMGVMIIPFISSLSDDVMHAVPVSLRNASLGLGATQSETIRQVVLPAALPGIMGAVLLAISRAIGETMIVVMAAGLAANMTLNPLESVTTVTVQMVMLLVGDEEFNSPKTLSAFALGLTLLVITLILNVIALRIVKKYREQYD